MGSHRRYGRRDSLAEARFIMGRQDDALTACEQTEAEELAADGLLGFDPTCRYAHDGFELGLHACTTRDGHLVYPGQSCFLEARQQIIEQGIVIGAAEEAVQ